MDFLAKKVVSVRSITHKQYEKLEDVKITYFLDESLFGNYLAAFLNEELCFLQFYDHNMGPCLALLQELYKPASLTLKEDFEPPPALKILLKGTKFEVAVWTELLNIRRGETRSYNDIAEAIGHPKAGRAVGNAVGKNHIGCVVPCHRVIRKNGELGGFGSGPQRKLRLLNYEGAKILVKINLKDE